MSLAVEKSSNTSINIEGIVSQETICNSPDYSIIRFYSPSNLSLKTMELIDYEKFKVISELEQRVSNIVVDGYRNHNFFGEASHPKSVNSVEEDITIVRYLIKNNNSGQFISTVSKMQAKSINDLPAFSGIMKKVYTEDTLNLLNSLDQNKIWEISSLTNVPNTSDLVTLETVRALFQESLGNNEVWVGRIVEATRDAFNYFFGPSIKTIGEKISIKEIEEDPDFDSEIFLVPFMFEPDKELDILLNSIKESLYKLGFDFDINDNFSFQQILADSLTLEKLRLLKNSKGDKEFKKFSTQVYFFINLTEGLSNDKLRDDLLTFRNLFMEV